MNEATRARYLKAALVGIGLVYVFGIYVCMRIWPDAWTWQPRHPAYEHMILGVYATLGVFLILAARQPTRHASLIWFTVASNLVHSGIMAAQAIATPVERGNFYGDIPALIIVALVLALLMPQASPARGAPTADSGV